MTYCSGNLESEIFQIALSLNALTDPQAAERPQSAPQSPAVRAELDDLHSGASSPSKRPSRMRPWEKIWSLDYRLEGDKQ